MIRVSSTNSSSSCQRKTFFSTAFCFHLRHFKSFILVSRNRVIGHAYSLVTNTLSSFYSVDGLIARAVRPYLINMSALSWTYHHNHLATFGLRHKLNFSYFFQISLDSY